MTTTNHLCLRTEEAQEKLGSWYANFPIFLGPVYLLLTFVNSYQSQGFTSSSLVIRDRWDINRITPSLKSTLMASKLRYLPNPEPST